MNNNLQIGDKTFPGVAFQGGTIWVDENEHPEPGQLCLTHILKRVIPKTKGTIMPGDLIIAQSPDLNLESIPVVRVEDENISEIKRLILKLLPPEDYGEDSNAEELWNRILLLTPTYSNIIVEVIAHPDSSTMSGHFEPITFKGEDGRTHFKIKTV